MNNFDQLIILLAPLPVPADSGWFLVVEMMQTYKHGLTLIGIAFFGAMAGTLKKIYKDGRMGAMRGFMYFFVSLVVGCGSSIIGEWVLARIFGSIPDAIGFGLALLCGYGGFELSNYWDRQAKNPERLYNKIKDSNKSTPS